jgi:hypothetical protein
MLKENVGNPMEVTSLCWSFYCINDNAKVDLENIQMMC